MSQSQLPEWAADLPVKKPRPVRKPPTARYQPPVRDVEVREERVGDALIRWAFDGETGAFDGAVVFNGSGWKIGDYRTERGARAAAARVNREP